MTVAPFAVELLAVKFGLGLDADRRLGNVVIETDCLEVVCLINAFSNFGNLSYSTGGQLCSLF